MPNLEQIPIRATQEMKNLIKLAADKLGLSLSAFLRQAGIEKAHKVLGTPPTKAEGR